MKQLIITIACILIILVGGTLEIKYITKCATYLKYDLEYIKNATNNNNYEYEICYRRPFKGWVDFSSGYWEQEARVY